MNQLKRVSRAGQRLYQYADEPVLYPSVTSVLNTIDKPFLKTWALNMSMQSMRSSLETAMATPGFKLTQSWINEHTQQASQASDSIAQQAANYGTRAHECIDKLIQGEAVVADEDIQSVVKGFMRWNSSQNLTFDPQGDTRVFSKKYGFAGALDAVGLDSEGRLVIVDFKTTNSLAAYAVATQEMMNTNSWTGVMPRKPEGATEYPLPEAYVVRFDKQTGNAETKQVADIDVAFACFKAALYIFKACNDDLLTSKPDN